MDLKKLRKPNVTEENVKDLVQYIYGLEVTTTTKMNSFNDQNFHIQVSQRHHNPFISHVSSTGYTLKIINTIKSSLDQHFESMHAAMLHLFNKGIRVPLPVMNLKGRTWTLENLPLLSEDGGSNEGNCGVHLLTYIEGETLTSGTCSYDMFFQWGLLTAKVHKALEELSCPGLQKKSILYSLEHIPDIVEYMEELNEKKKKLVYTVLEQYQTEILKNMDQLPKGFIHGDASGQNILKQKNDQAYSIDGILDFEDMHYGAYLWDIGLMLAHIIADFESTNPFEQAGYALSGYLSFRSLNELEMSLLKLCIECRLCQASVFCEYSSRIDPSNSYISKFASNEIRWIMLEKLRDTKLEDILKMWSEVRQKYQST